MTKRVITTQVNIDLHPENLDYPHKVTEITLGDLHANFVKLMYFLVREGVVEISPSRYKRLVEIYKTPPQYLTAQLILEFDEIIDSLSVINTNILLRLIGDECADRGQNDYYILKLIQKLRTEKVNLRILLSNHGVEIVYAFELFDSRGELRLTSLGNIYASSFFNLNILINNGLVSQSAIEKIMNDVYKPCLKLLDYTLDKESNNITIYSHAPIGLECIQTLAQSFNVSYQDKTSVKLAQTIERINIAFESHVKANTVHDLSANQKISEDFCLNSKSAVAFILWNRNYHSINRPQVHSQGYGLAFVHGHDAYEVTHAHITNLDNILGKSERCHQGEYTILATDELSLVHQHGHIANQIRHFQMQMRQILSAKSKDLRKKGFFPEAQAFNELKAHLDELCDDYSVSQLTLSEFKNQCYRELDATRPQVYAHRGVLAIIAWLIEKISYLLPCLSFFRPLTDSEKKIQSLSASINELDETNVVSLA